MYNHCIMADNINKPLSITVIAVGLFLELQVHIEQEKERLEQDVGEREEDRAQWYQQKKSKEQQVRSGTVNYFVTPYTKHNNSMLTIAHLERILKFGSSELERLFLSDGCYEVMARDVAASQVLVVNSEANTTHDQCPLSFVSARFAECPLTEPLSLQKYEPSMEREQFEKLGKALGEDIVDITGALLVLSRIVTGQGGLEELKDRLMAFQNNLPHQGKGPNQNLYLDCMHLLHGLCNVRISVPPTSSRDYLQRLLGFVLRYSGVDISTSAGHAFGTFQLTTSKGVIHDHRQSNHNFAAKAMLRCTIYGPDVDVGEIARSMMPMFVEDNLQPETLQSLHHFATKDSEKMVSVIRRLEKQCLEMKPTSFSDQQDGKYSVENFVQWLYSKCQHHHGERLLLYYYTITGVAKLVRQYEIFASACSHLFDEGLFTALSSKGKDQVILLRAQDLKIIPKHPLDEIIDKRIWTFFPWGIAEREHQEQDGGICRNSARLSMYHQFMIDLISLLPHLQHYDMEDLKRKIQDITTGPDHDSLWMELRMTSMKKRTRQFSDMACGEFQNHLNNVPLDMSFIHPELFQFRLIFCSNSHACREMKLYTSSATMFKDAKAESLFQLDGKCKSCFRNALLCAVTIYQQLHMALSSITAEVLHSSMQSALLKNSGGRRSSQQKEDSSSASTAGKNRCLTYIKSLIDEFLPAAVIRYLWGRKAVILPSHMTSAIAQIKPLPAAQFPWFQHGTCGKVVPPIINTLLCFAKEIARKKCLEMYTQEFECMLGVLSNNMCLCCNDNERSDQCINAIIKFFDHITDHAQNSVDKRIVHQIPAVWCKKLWPEPKKRKRHEEESTIIDDNHDNKEDGHVMNVLSAQSGYEKCSDEMGLQHKREKNDKRGKLVGPHSFILSECKVGNDRGDNSSSEHDQDEESNDDEDSDECSWDSRDNNFGLLTSINSGVLESNDDDKVENSGKDCCSKPKPFSPNQEDDKNGHQHDQIEVSSTSDDESIYHLDLGLAMSLATTYAGAEFASLLRGFLIMLAPCSIGNEVSFKIPGVDVMRYQSAQLCMDRVEGHLDNIEGEELPAVLKGSSPKPARDGAEEDVGKSGDLTPTRLIKKQSKISFSRKNSTSSTGAVAQTMAYTKSPYAITPATMNLLKKKRRK